MVKGKGVRKQPKLAHTPKTSKKPKVSSCAGSSDGSVIAWHFGTVDKDGEWGWQRVDADTLWNEIHLKLANFETMTWGALANSGSHAVSVSSLCDSARKRLVEIEQDDVDSLFSLRLSGKQRVWGIRASNILKIIWWDPEHQVCPSNKKHT